MADKELNIILRAKDEASKVLKNVSDSIKDNLDKISAGAAIAGGALIAFSGKALNDFADLGETIDNFSKSTGVGAEAATSLKMVAEGMGSSLDSVASVVKKMEVNLEDMSENTKEADEALKPLNLSFKDLQGLYPEDQLFKIGNAIGKIEDPAKKTALAIQFFGKSGTELLPIFEGGTASLNEFKAAAADAGLIMDEYTVEQAVKLDDAMDKLNASVHGATLQIGAALAPAIADLVNTISPVIQQISLWLVQNPELTTQILAVTAGILGLIAVLYPLSLAIGVVSSAFLFLAANPIVLVIASLAALGGAIYLAISNWDAFHAKVLAIWSSIISSISTAVSNIIATINNLIFSVVFNWSTGWQSVSEITQGVLTNLGNSISSGIQRVLEGITSGMNSVKNVWGDIWNAMFSVVTAIIDGILKAIDNLIGGINRAIETTKGALSFAQGAINNSIDKVYQGLTGAAAPSATLKKRASGGPVSAGEGYMVGENGPEYFSPSQDGVIIPNNKLSGGSLVINITGNTLLDSNAAVKIGDMIMSQFRLQRRLA